MDLEWEVYIRWSQRRRAFQVKRVTYIKDRRGCIFREEEGLMWGNRRPGGTWRGLGAKLRRWAGPRELEIYLVGVKEPVRVVSEGMASGKMDAGPPWVGEEEGGTGKLLVRLLTRSQELLGV